MLSKIKQATNVKEYLQDQKRMIIWVTYWVYSLAVHSQEYCKNTQNNKTVEKNHLHKFKQ